MRRRPEYKVLPAIMVVVLALLAACADGPTSFLADQRSTNPDSLRSLGPGHILQELACGVAVPPAAATPAMHCSHSARPTSRTTAPVIVGGQGVNVLLENDEPMTIGGLVHVPNVALTNLMSRPLGTPDGEIRTGIRVFFQYGPTGPVRVVEPSGVSTFLAANQEYFLYDVILNTGETSPGQAWKFELNGATSFEFGVLVAADQPPPPPPTTLTLQPDAVAGKDAPIVSTSASTNRGDNVYLMMNMANAIVAGLVEFDLSPLPSGVEILEATLSVYHYTNVCGPDVGQDPPGGPCQYDVHAVTGAWSESTVTWSTGHGLRGDVIASIVIDDVDKETFRDWDVTPLVQAWYEGSVENDGFWIEKSSGGSQNLFFLSSDWTTAAQRPKLVITYQEP